MNEHERLKRICDEIGYSPKFEFGKIAKFYLKYNYFNDEYPVFINVREIIFTPEFWNTFIKYYYLKFGRNDGVMDTDIITPGIMNNLHDPVTYLYNLIFNK